MNATKRKLTRLINRLLSPLGIEIRRTKTGGRSSMFGALSAMVERGHSSKTVVEAGASNGIWSEMVMKYYPEASYLLIEALPTHESSLVKFCKKTRKLGMLSRLLVTGREKLTLTQVVYSVDRLVQNIPDSTPLSSP